MVQPSHALAFPKMPSKSEGATQHGEHPQLMAVSGWWCNFTILKNDGLRQWEGSHPIYEMKNNPNA